MHIIWAEQTTGNTKIILKCTSYTHIFVCACIPRKCHFRISNGFWLVLLCCRLFYFIMLSHSSYKSRSIRISLPSPSRLHHSHSFAFICTLFSQQLPYVQLEMDRHRIFFCSQKKMKTEGPLEFPKKNTRTHNKQIAVAGDRNACAFMRKSEPLTWMDFEINE